MTFGLGQDSLWPVPPDWRNGVRERLSWSTTIHVAPKTAHSQHIAGRIGPLRSFQFETLDRGQDRRLADALLHGRGVRAGLMPVWPDGQVLREEHGQGEAAILALTVGFDFVAGGRALLWRGVRQWEVVTIAAIGPDGLMLDGELSQRWPPGTRLYPLRRARLDGNAQIHTITTDVHRTGIRMRIDEPSDWPAALPATTYRGHPVLGRAPEPSGNGSAHYERITENSAGEGGASIEFDLSGFAAREQSHVWELWGRAQQAEFRSLVYALRGRQAPLWSPTWANDLQPVAPIGAGATLLTVEWAGYTAMGGVRPNRSDIRIELRDGTVLFRRLLGSAEDGEVEVLQLDAPLGQAVAPHHVRRISWMGLGVLASDEIEWHHVTDADGRARVITGWREVLPDV